MGNRLLTAEQVAEEYGLPSPRTVRTMRQNGLPTVRIGKACLFEREDVEQFIQASKVTICPDETQARVSNGSRSGAATTSSGTSSGSSVSVLLARQTSQKLKTLSRRSSASNDGKPATVTQLRTMP